MAPARKKNPNALAPGIFKTPTGFRSFQRVGGTLESQRWPKATTLTAMKQWQEDVKVLARRGLELPAGATTFEEDARLYLSQVRAMPSYTWRETDIRRWVCVLGRERNRHSITSPEVRKHLEQWRAEGYAANTVNHRRTALMHLFTVLDGRSAPNPARDVPRYRESTRPPRALSPHIVKSLLAYMPESLSKARLNLMFWTGWPHAQIMRLEPSDVDWDRAVYIRARLKGQGIQGRWLPLLPQGWEALRQFKKLGAWGYFSTGSLRKSLRLAAQKLATAANTPADTKAIVADITPYDLRHSFLTMVALLTRNARAVQTLGLHSDPRQSNRYTEAAVDPLVQHALELVAEALESKKKSEEKTEKLPPSYHPDPNATIH